MKPHKPCKRSKLKGHARCLKLKGLLASNTKRTAVPSLRGPTGSTADQVDVFHPVLHLVFFETLGAPLLLSKGAGADEPRQRTEEQRDAGWPLFGPKKTSTCSGLQLRSLMLLMIVDPPKGVYK